MSKKPKDKKPGPKPERVKSDKDWVEAMKDALKKKRPKEGWPEPEKDENQQGERNSDQ